MQFFGGGGRSVSRQFWKWSPENTLYRVCPGTQNVSFFPPLPPGPIRALEAHLLAKATSMYATAKLFSHIWVTSSCSRPEIASSFSLFLHLSPLLHILPGRKRPVLGVEWWKGGEEWTVMGYSHKLIFWGRFTNAQKVQTHSFPGFLYFFLIEHPLVTVQTYKPFSALEVLARSQLLLK